MKNKVLISLLLIVMCLTLTGCGEKESNSGTNNNNIKEEEKENNSSTDLGVGKYKVEKTNNSILVITNDGNSISTTKYEFSNEVLVGATLTQKCVSSAVAKSIYDTMKNEPSITNIYSDINISGDTITLKFKNENLVAYSGMSLNDMYNLLYQTYSSYMQ